MTALPAVNNQSTTLTADLADIDTTAIVASTVGWASAGIFSVGTEVIAYSGKTLTTFTGLTRGYDGTVADNHSNGATVSLRIIAKHLNDATYQNASPTLSAVGGIPAGTTFPEKTTVQEMFAALLGSGSPTPIALSVGANITDTITEDTQYKATYDITLIKTTDDVMESYKLTLIMRAPNKFSYLISDYVNYPDSGGIFDVSVSVAYSAPDFQLILTAATADWEAIIGKTSVLT